MADNFVGHVNTCSRQRHFSISTVFKPENYLFERCFNKNCIIQHCFGNGYHCPLCVNIAKEKCSRIREHFVDVHANKRVCNGGNCIYLFILVVNILTMKKWDSDFFGQLIGLAIKVNLIMKF